jgi:acetoin utilization protein AcuA
MKVCDLPSREIERPTPAGNLRIRCGCTSVEMKGYTFDQQFGTYAQFRSLYTKRETLEKIADHEGANVVLALTEAGHIVGFGVLDYPEPNERWVRLGPKQMMEVKAIEVCRDWRGAHVADAILGMLLKHPLLEKMIAYMVGYSWTWDLDGTGKTAQEYRNILLRLFSTHEFVEMQTNEPNICLKPENLFMARVGKKLSDEIVQEFKWLRFGVNP